MSGVSKRKKLLVGVSGGRDSMVLLHALLGVGFKNLVVCHLNHTLRGRSSEADARLVVAEARRLGLPLEHARARTAEFASAEKKSLELAARELRMAFFEQCSARAKTKHLVLAHHADDQVETCLFNFLRGTGAAGLGGIKPVSQLSRCTVHRPLLGVRRTQIEAFRKSHAIRFREDTSNAGLEHTRNKLRHRVMPLLAEVMGDSYRSAILRAALGDARERAERSRRHQSGERPFGAARVAHPVGERRRSRRGRTGPRAFLALGASHPNKTVVAAAAIDVADPTSLHVSFFQSKKVKSSQVKST